MLTTISPLKLLALQRKANRLAVLPHHYNSGNTYAGNKTGTKSE